MPATRTQCGHPRQWPAPILHSQSTALGEWSAVQLRAVWESGVQVEVGAGALERWAKKRVPAASGKSQFLSMIAQESGDQAVRCGHLFLFDLRSHRGADG
jgi:hypothetical protein